VKYFPRECILTVKDLKELCEEWKQVLGLENWQVVIKICRDDDINSSGRCDWVLTTRQVSIKILDNIDWHKIVKGFPQDMEKTLVHELLHCVFAMIDNKEDGSYEEVLLHNNIDLLANALVGLKRGKEVE